MKKNRKCKKCQGKGFIFGKNYIIKEGSFGYEPHEYGIKLTCPTCFGKGVKW
jgi:DnaJ-class molecular chaperone